MTKQEFAELFTLLCTTYNKEATKTLMSAYYMVLSELSKEQFQDAIMKMLATRKYTNLPMPADILEAVYGNPDDEALIALKELEDAMGVFGAYKSVIFKDKVIMACVKGMGGWQRICQMPLDEWKFQKQEFLKLYKAYMKSGKAPLVDYLVGIAEQKNRFEGYLEDADETPVHLVGYEPNYPKALPALTIKTNISAQKQAIENKRDIVKMITVKGIK